MRTAKLTLAYRRYGRHYHEKTLEGVPTDGLVYVKVEPLGSYFIEDFRVDEDKLLSLIPNGWLPVEPEAILLCVGNGHFGSGVTDTARFRSWAKYFDSYSLTIELSEGEYDEKLATAKARAGL